MLGLEAIESILIRNGGRHSMSNDLFKQYVFSGSHQEVGRQHGEALRMQIREHLELCYDLAFKNSKIQKSQAVEIADKFKPYINKYAPGFSDELEGIREGAGITLQEALLLQVRQEVVNMANYASPNFECTTFAITDKYTSNGKVYAGQNADLTGNLEDISNVVNFAVAGKPQVLMVVPAGQISYIGMNSEGMSGNGNFLYCTGWKKGFPRYLMTRFALEQRSLNEACKVLESIDERASSRNVLIADYKGQIADFEFTATDYGRIYPEGYFVHSNHFLSPEMEKYEIGNKEQLHNSICRFKRLSGFIEQNEGSIDNTAIKSFLSDHTDNEDSLCVHPVKEREYHTFASVISNLSDRVMEVSKGNPCCNPYGVYKFE
jgi:isopenicillin-N N-acyltransferase-like protein